MAAHRSSPRPATQRAGPDSAADFGEGAAPSNHDRRSPRAVASPTCSTTLSKGSGDYLGFGPLFSEHLPSAGVWDFREPSRLFVKVGRRAHKVDDAVASVASR